MRITRPFNRPIHLLVGTGGFLLILLAATTKSMAAVEVVRAYKTDSMPVIDGILDDDLWKEAPSFSDFTSFIPDFGKVEPQRTTAWVAYDQENLYFAFDCQDPEPDKIKANVSPRDQIMADDWICLNIDSRFDQQGINAFYVNPLGIQMDTRFDAGKEDASIDLVWYSAGTINDHGYCVEVRIPLKSLRFSTADPVSMGLLLERYISRTTTHVGYPHLDPAMGYNFLPQLMRVDYYDVRHYTLFEAIPAATYTYKDKREGEGMAKDIRRPDLSLTLKYGITSDLVLDAALNPDFSQVESDAGQVDVNLRYDLLYPEKRPFFLEGKEKFNIGATQASVVDPMYYLVHTRTIVNPIAGIKFTGNIDRKNSIALLYGADELPRDTAGQPVHFAHFPILRYKYNLHDDGYLGALYAGRETAGSSNRVAGTDAQIRVNKSSMLEYNLFGSQTIEQGVRKNSHAEGFYYHSETRDLAWGTSLKNIGEDFNVATGYITRTGISQATFLLHPFLYTHSRIFRRFDIELFGSATYDWPWSMWETFNHASVQAMLGGTTLFKVKYSLSNEIFLGERFNTGGFHLLLQGRYRTWFTGAILYRRVHAIYYSTDPFGGMSNRITAQADFQPWPKFETDLSLVYNDFTRSSDHTLMYRYPISRLKITYQFNKYLFIRGILEYNGYRKSLLTDFLFSFTYIPGTVFYVGYGSLYEQTDATLPFINRELKPLEMQRGFFLKLSYLFRS
jgi:hypothetical protein